MEHDAEACHPALRGSAADPGASKLLHPAATVQQQQLQPYLCHLWQLQAAESCQAQLLLLLLLLLHFLHPAAAPALLQLLLLLLPLHWLLLPLLLPL
jgi:hypothetical protein